MCIEKIKMELKCTLVSIPLLVLTFIAVNHLGPFLLTNLLLPDLKQTKGRIVNVAAMVHKPKSGVWSFVSTEGEILF